MASTNLLWHWSGTVSAQRGPAWLTREMLLGQYQSPTYATSSGRTSAGVNNARSGKCTNGFAAALDAAMYAWNGGQIDGFGQNSKFCIAEFLDCGPRQGAGSSWTPLGERIHVAYNTSTHKFLASKNGQALDFAKSSSAPFFYALWPMFIAKDATFMASFTDAMDGQANGDTDKLCSAACRMADIAYYLTSGSSPVIEVGEPSAVSNLSMTRIHSSSMKPNHKTVVGCLQDFGGGVSGTGNANSAVGGKKSGVMKTADFVDSFSLNPQGLPEELEKLVPKLDDRYIVGETLVNICKHIKESTGRPRPIRNILLRGEPGTGKTEMYTGIAAGLHLPLYTFAANAMTEPYDLIGQFVPVDNESGENSGKGVPMETVLKDLKVLKQVPSWEDITMDPVFSYQEISGEYKEDATTFDCMSYLLGAAQNALDAKLTDDGQQRFKFVPGQLIYAMKNGGVWGFDEVTLPQNAGVVPALNPAMDGTQSITLPNGEIVKRHPNCVFVGTTNIDLEGCRQLNQAWVDRCQLIIDLKEPSDDELIARIKSMTGYDDVKDADIDLGRFVQAYHGLKEIAKRKRLDDGQIGPRKLADWVLSTMITRDAKTSAEMTIISGATADEAGMEELRQKIEDFI